MCDEPANFCEIDFGMESYNGCASLAAVPGKAVSLQELDACGSGNELDCP